MKRAILVGLLTAGLMAGTAHASNPTPDNLPPHVDRETFGTIPSSGDPVRDCGAWVERDDLSDEALAAVEKCLDLHGWTYEED